MMMAAPMSAARMAAAEQRRPVRVPEIHVERVGGQHDGVAAEHDEAHDVEIELPAIAPVHVEAERDQRVDDGADQELKAGGGALVEEDRHDDEAESRNQQTVAQIGGAGHVAAPLKMPVGRNSRTITRMTKATVSL